MKSSITAMLLACYFLAGSVIFPLSDFSLMRDLPSMYHSYCEIRAGEPDICDFVGDYLLHGKELFGNNSHDAQPKNARSLQFQHQPTLSMFFIQHVYRLLTVIGRPLWQPPVFCGLNSTTEYYDEHLRPPIA